MRYLPIFFDTQEKTIVVIGGGPAAEAKLRTLIRVDGELLVFTKGPSDQIKRWANEGKLTIVQETPEKEDFKLASLIYAATEDPAENAGLADKAKDLGIPVNAADQKEDCSFITPAIVDRDPIVVAIGSEGTAPGLARSLKADIESRLPQSTGPLARKIAELRASLSAIMPDFSDRQRLWAKVFSSGKTLEKRLAHTPEEIEATFESALKEEFKEKAGSVSLVGAGPGDIELLTLGAQRRLHSADVIVYDRLVSQGVLDLGRREAKYIYVGKAPGNHSTRQGEINRIIVEKALEGNHVVRLKGGDPLIFGRADEEIEALEQAGVDYDIVPGITSAAAAAATIGKSLTSRGHNKSVTLMTGHDSKGFAEQDWKKLSDPTARAAIYMGLGASRFIQGRLLLHGADRNHPVTIVENASRADEKVVETTLGNLAQDIEKYGILGPAILLYGYAKTEAVAAEFLPRKAVK